MKRTIYLLCLIALTTTSSMAADGGRLGAYLWFLQPDGTLSVGEGSTPGTAFDLQNDLGYDSDEQIIGVRLTAGTGQQLAFDYVGLDLESDNTITRDIFYAGSTFQASDTITSAIEASLVRGTYRINFGDPAFRAGFQFGIQYVDVDARLRSDRTGEVDETIRAASPLLGAYAEGLSGGFFFWQASLLAMDFGYDDIEAAILDFEINGQILITENFVIGGGYRSLAMEASDDSELIDVDIDLSGPMAYAGLRW